MYEIPAAESLQGVNSPGNYVFASRDIGQALSLYRLSSEEEVCTLSRLQYYLLDKSVGVYLIFELSSE
jgi:hypothetical protein